MTPSSLIGLVLLRAILSGAQMDTCYYPSGDIASADTPCSSADEASACCGPGALCTSEGLCWGAGSLSRGSCTDQSWESSQCADACRTANPEGGMPIAECSSGRFVCGAPGWTPDPCSGDATIFELDLSPAAVFLRPAQAAGIGFPNGLELTARTNLIPNITTPQNETTQNESDACPSFSATAQPEHTGYTAAQMAGVGAGVGVPLLLALVAALVYIVKLRKQHHYAPAAAAAAWSTREPQANWEQKRMDAMDQPYEVDGRGRLPELQS